MPFYSLQLHSQSQVSQETTSVSFGWGTHPRAYESALRRIIEHKSLAARTMIKFNSFVLAALFQFGQATPDVAGAADVAAVGRTAGGEVTAAVVGVMTGFGYEERRQALRKSWFPPDAEELHR